MTIKSCKIFLPTCLFQPTLILGTPEYTKTYKDKTINSIWNNTFENENKLFFEVENFSSILLFKFAYLRLPNNSIFSHHVEKDFMGVKMAR